MANGVNNSERFVYEVCRHSFLSLWSYVNPQGRGPGKELCDILVVCDPHVIVISVKDVDLRNPATGPADWERWRRKAIDASFKQIKGAVRWLDEATHVVTKEGASRLPLPPLTRRVYHRIAVAFGGRREVPINSRSDKTEGIVHVLDEQSLSLLLRHLDTITDFVQYLNAKEQLLSGAAVIVSGGEENLLAMYLNSGRSFPKSSDLLVLEGDLWDEMASKPEFLAKLERDRDSYLWDRCIDALAKSVLDGSAYFNPGISDAELGLREMAMEDRFSRRCLAKSLLEFLDLARARKVRARMTLSVHRKTAYVFVPARLEDDPETRLTDLTARCWVAVAEARKTDEAYHTAIGLAMSEVQPGHPLELVYFSHPNWTVEDQEMAEKLRNGADLWRSPQRKCEGEDEYPEVM